MAQQQLFEENGRKLLSPNVGLAEKLAIVVDIRERIEVVHGKEYASFLHYLFPAFRALLMEELPPQFRAGPANKIRNGVLEIISRLPPGRSNDPLKPYLQQVLEIVLRTMAADNEENVLVCLRVMFDLHKTYGRSLPDLASFVQPFLDFVRDTYTNMGAAVAAAFPGEGDRGAAAAAGGGGILAREGAGGALLPGSLATVDPVFVPPPVAVGIAPGVSGGAGGYGGGGDVGGGGGGGPPPHAAVVSGASSAASAAAAAAVAAATAAATATAE